MDTLMVSLMFWLFRAVPEWNIPVEIPAVMVVSHETLCPPVLQHCDVLARYDQEEAQIMISEFVDMDSLQGKSILLHELVHHLQFVTGENKQVACIAQLEYRSYELQNRWLVDNGGKPWADNFTMMARSLC